MSQKTDTATNSTIQELPTKAACQDTLEASPQARDFS